jgi:hypothetical protein
MCYIYSDLDDLVYTSLVGLLLSIIKARFYFERYKARLVAKGFSKKEGINYKETFSPVSSKDSFRIVMALVAHFDFELHQMDVKTAFLNGDLTEDVYML